MGIEVSIGGWATTFLLEERNGDDRSGYVTSGYFGGLTVGMSFLQVAQVVPRRCCLSAKMLMLKVVSS